MVVCLERGADLHMAQLMPLPVTVSCSSKIQIGFTFLVPADPGSPGKRTVKRVCVCVCVFSLVECYSNHTATRISIQTAGLAFGGTGLCSYRVRGVDGSCAKHLTVESYMVIYVANSLHLLLLVFHHPLSLSFQT